MGDITVNVKELIEIVVSLAGFVAAVGVLYKLLKRFVSNITKDTVVETVKDETQDIFGSISELKDSVSDIDKTLKNYIESANNNFSDMKKTMCDDVREKIYRVHKECMKANFIDDHEWSIIQELWDDYHNRLDGNSFVGDLVEDLRNLYKQNNN